MRGGNKWRDCKSCYKNFFGKAGVKKCPKCQEVADRIKAIEDNIKRQGKEKKEKKKAMPRSKREKLKRQKYGKRKKGKKDTEGGN